MREDLIPAVLPESIDGFRRLLIRQGATQDLLKFFLRAAWNDFGISKATFRDSTSLGLPIVAHVAQDVTDVNQKSIDLLFRRL